MAGWYASAETLASNAADVHTGWNGRSGSIEHPTNVYVTLNPCTHAMTGRADNRLKAIKARTKDDNITSVRNLLIDIDPVRPADVSASDAEKKVAIAVTKRVRQFLVDDCFWPEPMVADSGNGGHLVFKIHFPDDMDPKACGEKIKELLHALGSRFDTTETAEDGQAVSVNIDRGVFNPSRLVKLWGTVARKGDQTKDRPHRASRVVQLPPDEQGPVTLPMIDVVLSQLVAAPGKKEEKDTGVKDPAVVAPCPFLPVSGAGGAGGEKRKSGKLDVDAYLAHYGVEVTAVKEMTNPKLGDYKLWVLDQCLFDPDHSGNESAIGQQESGVVFYQCFHNTCKTDENRRWKQARKLISGDDSLAQFMVGGDEDWGQGGGKIPFPFVDKKGKPKALFENFVALIDAYGIEIRYNIMGKHEDIKLPGGLWSDSDRLGTLARDYLDDLCARHGLNSQRLDSWMRLRGQSMCYHPVRVWLESKEWDGVSRFEDLLATVKTPTIEAWRTYLRRWLIQGVAALYDPKFCCRGVLTFTGAQGVGKTSWFKSLVPESLGAFGEGLNLDPGDKDSTVITLSKWMVELGEVDATFRKADISKLKAFLTKDTDVLRVPYGRTYDKWKRMTFWGATVNDPQFLVDGTGNTRWWCIETTDINWGHGIDMQQVWAEAKTWFDLGESWFLDRKETNVLNDINKTFEVVNPIKELILEKFDFESARETWQNLLTTTAVLQKIGFERPTQAQASMTGVILKELVGDQIRKTSGRYYPMPVIKHEFSVGVNSNNGAADDWLSVNDTKKRVQ